MKLSIYAILFAIAGAASAQSIAPPVTMQPIPNPPAKAKAVHAKPHKAAPKPTAPAGK
jgi:hypothetical protein